MIVGKYLFFSCFSLLVSHVLAVYDAKAQNNAVIYWGQGSGATKATLAETCTSSGADIVVISFLTTFFGPGGHPIVDFASYCGGASFPGSSLLQCDQIGKDIATCQSQGIRVLLSLGGATSVVGFTDANQASTFADTLWNTFGGGTSTTRPFGSASVDGFDLDIESGSPSFYTQMVDQLRKHYAEDSSKTYYVTAAPQCVFPDAHLSQVLDGSAFDMVFVQFYNNPCALDKAFNYDVWDTWSKTAPNKAVQIFIGVPAAAGAAGSGFVEQGTLSATLSSVQSKYPSLGGVMMWDASFLDFNGNNIMKTVKAAIGGSNNAKVSPASVAQTSSAATIVSDPLPTNSGGIETAPILPVLRQAAIAQAPACTTCTTSECVKCASTMTTATTVRTTATAQTPLTTSPAAAGSAPAPISSLATPGPQSLSAGACATNGQMQCVPGGYSTCDNGSWVVRACAAGTVCRTAGDSVLCDFPQKMKRMQRART